MECGRRHVAQKREHSVIRLLKNVFGGVNSLKHEVKLIGRSEREERLINVALYGCVVEQNRGSDVLDRSVESAHFVANKSVYPKVGELGAGRF